MKTVQSVSLQFVPSQTISLPLGSRVLRLAQVRDEESGTIPILFYHGDPDEERKETRTVYGCTTGNEAPLLDQRTTYLGSVVETSGYATHFFISI